MPITPLDRSPLDIQQEKILILDFGSQYSQLIARRLRETGIYCEIHPHDLSAEAAMALAPAGIVCSGGPESVTGDNSLAAPAWAFSMEVPLLGICYGMQAMAMQLGGEVEASDKREFGYARVEVTGGDQLIGELQGEDNYLDVWMSHGDRVTKLPPGFVATGTSANSDIAVMADESRRFYGVQFHPEVEHTPRGAEIFRRFVKHVCGCAAIWTPANIVDSLIRRIRSRVGDRRVILGLSGGVDSSVVAALLSRAIGDRLICVFVDNGLLRFDERRQVEAMLGEGSGNTFDLDLVTVEAEAKFMAALEGVSDPEQKRKVIGNTFIEVFDAEASRIGDVAFLAQGTIYPDVIESAGHKDGKAHVIKSHHNVGGLPERMELELLEPLRELFKDEVRKIGLELGLSHEMVFRHPFPGPGLGVRILGEVKKEYADLLRRADAIYLDELRAAGLYDQVSQAFAVFLPVRSVGVVGDARRYEYVVALRAVETTDFMTASWARLPYGFLARVSARIINEIDGISRVTYDISSKPPATIEWE